MKIEKKVLMQSIQKEFKDARDWCKQGYGHCYMLRIDTSNAHIWANLYLSENDWTVYHSDTIMQLDASRDCATAMVQSYLEDAVQKLMIAGWQIIE